MTQGLPVRMTGKWTFHLHKTDPLQFRITSEQDTNAQLIVEGHDISTLLDYLYEHRELIYSTTHDQETLRREASEHAPVHRRESRRVRPVRYFYDGEERIRADQEPLASDE
jgi:hypothetical protein